MENIRLNKFQTILVLSVLAAIFLLVYFPSLTTPFPKHINEWQHINRALNLERGEYQWHNLYVFSLGFHLFLFVINQLADLIHIYKFLAPAWAVLTASVIFFIAYTLSRKNFLTAFLAMLFFASIKSNINLLGFYFFTPLSFAVPFIFLFIFFFIRGLEKENKKYLLLSLFFMLLLIPVHAISVTFALPILFFSCAFYYKYIKKEFRFFLIFLIIFLAGLFFYSFAVNLTIIESLGVLVRNLQFDRNWSIAETFNDSLTTTYPIIGGILAGIGFFLILWKKKKHLYPYIIWPLWLILMILIFRVTDISYLAPYHRNFYYFTISLPLLSAFGLSWTISFLTDRFKRINNNFITLPILAFAVFFSFISYYEEAPMRPPYTELINKKDYQDLVFLARFSRGKILAHPSISSEVIAPITGHKVVGELSDNKFNRKHVREFFSRDDCYFRDALIKVYEIDYIVSGQEISCGYKLLRSEHNYIYKVSD